MYHQVRNWTRHQTWQMFSVCMYVCTSSTATYGIKLGWHNRKQSRDVSVQWFIGIQDRTALILPHNVNHAIFHSLGQYHAWTFLSEHNCRLWTWVVVRSKEKYPNILLRVQCSGQRFEILYSCHWSLKKRSLPVRWKCGVHCPWNYYLCSGEGIGCWTGW